MIPLLRTPSKTPPTTVTLFFQNASGRGKARARELEILQYGRVLRRCRLSMLEVLGWVLGLQVWKHNIISWELSRLVLTIGYMAQVWEAGVNSSCILLFGQSSRSGELKKERGGEGDSETRPVLLTVASRGRFKLLLIASVSGESIGSRDSSGIFFFRLLFTCLVGSGSRIGFDQEYPMNLLLPATSNTVTIIHVYTI